MKFLSNLAIIALAVVVTDISIVDGDGDRSKAVVLIDYSDGTTDKLVVDKTMVSEDYPAIERAVLKIIDQRERRK